VKDFDSLACELVEDPPWSPPGMLSADLADQGSQLGGDLVAATLWPVGAIAEAENTTGFVAGDPSVDRLTSNAEMVGDLSDLPAILWDRHHCLIALIHDP
jgi:hypothetical protein